MARIRTIKPEFWKSEALSDLPEATHMLAAALLNYADDHGYFNANPKLIQAECSPLREPSVKVHESLGSLQAIGYVRLGTGADGRRYGHIVEFKAHQRVAHPTDSKISLISITWDERGNPPDNFLKDTETFIPEQGTGNREQGTGNRESREPRADIEAEFNSTFWPLVPKKQAKPDALKAYRAARKRASADILAEGMRRYALSVAGKDPEYIKLPAGWLRSERWADEPPPPKPAGRIDVILGARDDFSARINAASDRPDCPGDHEQLPAPEHHQEP
jgi:hypothetical protein